MTRIDAFRTQLAAARTTNHEDIQSYATLRNCQEAQPAVQMEILRQLVAPKLELIRFVEQWVNRHRYQLGRDLDFMPYSWLHYDGRGSDKVYGLTYNQSGDRLVTCLFERGVQSCYSDAPQLDPTQFNHLLAVESLKTQHFAEWLEFTARQGGIDILDPRNGFSA